jgi:hypothetical protein
VSHIKKLAPPFNQVPVVLFLTNPTTLFSLAPEAALCSTDSREGQVPEGPNQNQRAMCLYES